MVSNSNTIPDLSGKLLGLFSKLPHYLIMGTDKDGHTIFSNKHHAGLSKETAHIISRSIEQFIASESSWRSELDENYFQHHSELSLEAFRLQTDENNPIQYVFLVELSKPNVEHKPYNAAMEREPVIALLNNIIGLSSNLMRIAEKRPTEPFAKALYHKAWKIKEALQGSIKSKVKNLPEGYDLIDFNEVFAEALNKGKLNFNEGDVKVQTYTDPFIFFSHYKCLELLVTNLTKWCYNHSTKQPVTISFRVSESATGATIRLESEPVDVPEKVFANSQIQELVDTLKSTLKVISIAEDKVVLEVKIPGE